MKHPPKESASQSRSQSSQPRSRSPAPRRSARSEWRSASQERDPQQCSPEDEHIRSEEDDTVNSPEVRDSNDREQYDGDTQGNEDERHPQEENPIDHLDVDMRDDGRESSADYGGHDGRESDAPVAAPLCASPRSGLIEVTNVPNLSGKGRPPEKYLSDMFNPTLEILPDYHQDQGSPVQRSWSPSPDMVIMEMQNPELAESAARILDGLDLFGRQLVVRTLPPDSAVEMP